jgi:ribonuclease BN (tRNA processing enzyme)
MRVTTVGTGTAAPTPHRVCAGHLVQTGTVSLLLDCGSGSVYRMAALGLDWMGITHVALTHFHPDHTSDIPTLFFAWRYGALPYRSAPVQVIGPPGTGRLLAHFADLYGSAIRTPDYPLTVRELPAAQSIDLGGGVRLEARKVPHTDESVAYSVSAGGARFVYTGDTGFDASFGEWARGCSLLLAECSLPATMAMDTHLTPEQCGELARLAAPMRLALTHFYPPVERVDVRAIVAARYGGEVVLATDGWMTEIEER